MSEQTPNTAANDVEQLIRDQIRDNKVILYMKGTPQFPQCGFSAKAIEVLTQIGRPFAFVNMLLSAKDCNQRTSTVTRALIKPNSDK